MDYTVHGIFQARIFQWGPIPSPVDLLNPGTEPGSPALQADSLPTEFWFGFGDKQIDHWRGIESLETCPYPYGSLIFDSSEEKKDEPSNKWCYLYGEEIKLDFTSYTKHFIYEKKILATLFVTAK